ncbi:hypothetical protein [Cellulomonas septica]|uniref:Uncharacterized protein n=1 Tax=Cellulomonas septica TaxID=285080 RepID=A0ABX1JV67_9CELL|nr:hypothetical protein [Cellulomonas septica]NKY38203.1 hypothetical protein [Cellulomonas septica]
MTETYPASTGKDGLRIAYDVGDEQRQVLVQSMIDWVVLPDGEQLHGRLSQATRPGWMRRLVDEVAGRSGPLPSVNHPGRTVMYRTMAAVLAARLFDDQLWDVRCVSVDGIPATARELDFLPAELEGCPGSGVWRLTAGEESVAVLADGKAWTAAGDSLDLGASFAGGASCGDLAARVSHRHLTAT